MRLGRHNIGQYIVGITLAFFIHVCSASEKVIQLAVDSAIQEPLVSLCQRFSQKTHYKCKVHAAPAGHLYAQIMHGMSYDIFISTQEKYIPGLINAAKADPTSRFTLATARIVLWSADPDETSESLHETLVKNQQAIIAMANPGVTPYGGAAKEVLQEHNLWHNIQDRLIFGNNVQQTYNLVATQKARLGFVSLAQLSPAVRRAKLYWEPDAQSYQPVIHEAIMLKPNQPQEAVLAFMIYLQNLEASEILQEAGFNCSLHPQSHDVT